MTPKTAELYSLGVNAYLDDNYIHLHGRGVVPIVVEFCSAGIAG